MCTGVHYSQRPEEGAGPLEPALQAIVSHQNGFLEPSMGPDIGNQILAIGGGGGGRSYLFT